ncbi:MAG: hypothetical protein K2Q13_10160 [Nitrosomonas sp.]|uniref:hypothetical protein n=1 Tax=Nitrosomonas sp. TaxID=42353 RepID=UPI0025E249EA|nr:hypothetical protein [Nitrosomonas sp.]MBY0475405.1 hypothetical protein [Nitrosomonas sp.]
MNQLRTSEMLRRQIIDNPKVSSKQTLDAANEDDGAKELNGADSFTIADITMAAAAVIQQWVETDDLASGESSADRLLAMMIGIADENKDGEITEDEQAVLDVALNAAWDYLTGKGVTEEDADSLLNDFDGDVAERVRDLVASALPEGEDEASADIDDFVFGDDDQEPATMDAAYKKKMVIRKGKKVRINKRISGTVRLSAAQKVGIRKARMKSHSATARMRRAKSMKLRRKTGLK